MTNATESHPFDALTPGFILDAVEAQGYRCDCRLLTLNSYENRVYQVGIEEGEPLIVKFYRPQRWSDAQILEEHQFARELAEHELPVVAPLCNEAGESLFHYKGFRLACYPRKGGQAPELDRLDHLKVLGRLLGRIHRIGQSRPYKIRPCLDSRSFGHEPAAFLSEQFIPEAYREAYLSLTRDLLQQIDAAFARQSALGNIRVHGDCHSGNLLWRDGAPNFVDFDDSRIAPAVQDVWMLLSGDREQQRRQLEAIFEGYHEFHDFDFRELQLIEPLRTLRIIHYAAWLGRRWDDPAFPRTFPWFNTQQYWGEHILELREQFAALQEEPLSL